jgi:ubiquinone/menaquinone biosynthesis C-methylase UbiE
VALARETLSDVPGADIRQADVTDLPWPDDSFEVAMFGDVIEHLYEHQAAAALWELRRVLVPGGLLLVHTAPNRRFLRFGWPMARVALRAMGKGEVVTRTDDWIAQSKLYHVNEQTTTSLHRSLEDAGFWDVRAWIDPNVARDGHDHHLTSEIGSGLLARAGARVAGLGPFRELFGNDLYAQGRA